MSTQSLRPKPTIKPNQAFITKLFDEKIQSTPVSDFFNIGRAPENHLVLNDPYVSSRHARIELRPEGYIIKDLRSQNGTFVNGAAIVEGRLNPNDRVSIGRSELFFTVDREARELQMHLTSQNAKWQSQLERLPDMAQSSFPVLIIGPSGSGKEIIASLIHRYSSQSAGPFVSVNCSALTESLVESELFGHVAGSFTGATGPRKGAFEAARGGTLFLDEIGDLPLALQPKLLRALENREIKPVGSDKTIATDVRIVAATHKDLRQEVAERKFRPDLYFRLHIIQLHPPALKDRLEDFETLLYGFAKENKVRFSQNAIERLKEHPWHGNIRELKNMVSRASALYPQKTIEEDMVESLLDSVEPRITTPVVVSELPVIKQIEKKLIVERLIANKGNQRRTAAELNMPKSTLHDRIRNYNIDPEKPTEV